MLLNGEQIASWLRSNPGFFEDYAPLLADINLPHPHGGRTISISERQVMTLREKNKLLEQKLAELIQFGEENDSISEKVHRLALSLIAAPNLETALESIYTHLREHFSVPHGEIRIWGARGAEMVRREFGTVMAEIQQFTEAMTAPYCGQHAVYEVNHWFGEAGLHLKSYALVPLKTDCTIGLLALGSEDSQRFYPEMGTLFLNRIGELVTAGLERFVQRV